MTESTDSRGPHILPIEFTGSGSEYFRIWIVNLLLTIVTLGLYFPWAKVRRLRYFMGNTLVDGEPLGFHADPRKMFKGFCLVGALFGLYSYAGNVSPTAGFVALLIVVAIWPALFKSSLQFRLANTSWRGLRFRFHGSLAGAYRASAPLFIPGVFMVGVGALVPDAAPAPEWLAVALGLGVLVSLAITPWLLWNLKQYQHNHYGLASLQTTFKASAGDFYKLTGKIIGLWLLIIVAFVFLIGLVAVLFFGVSLHGGIEGIMRSSGLGAGVFIAIAAAVYMLLLFMMMSLKPYAITRLQNLVWTKTGNPSMRFISDLKFRSFLLLTVKNWLCIIFTLGLYWPFAAIASARMRLEAVTVKTSIAPDTLISTLQPAEGEAAGDAAGDFFGIDIGL